jgi:hypothetical protein
VEGRVGCGGGVAAASRVCDAVAVVLESFTSADQSATTMTK